MMLRWYFQISHLTGAGLVLILVLLDDAPMDLEEKIEVIVQMVLILVLLDDAPME